MRSRQAAHYPVGMQGIPLAPPMRMTMPSQFAERFQFADRRRAGIVLARQL